MDTRLELLTRVLDTAATRHKVIAQNVANVDTFGYQRLEVTFEDELTKVLAGGGDPSAVQPKVVVDETAEPRVDGNTVDIDREMNDLSKNALCTVRPSSSRMIRRTFPVSAMRAHLRMRPSNWTSVFSA